MQRVCVLLLALAATAGALVVCRLMRWNALPIAVVYWRGRALEPEAVVGQRHLVFVMVDHYEHGTDPGAAERNRRWCRRFREVADRHHDDYGNRFCYSWFYPYDHQNEDVMGELALMASEGYGEIEMHWHLGPTPLWSYPDSLRQAIRWYQRYGAMITTDVPPRTAFAYIAGNWDLDASRPTESHGVTNQLIVLHDAGCFADFTFSTIGTTAQPRKINAIYYAVDDPSEPKSYDAGVDVEAGRVTTGLLMMFQGPLTVGWTGAIEYGAVEADPRFDSPRVEQWVKANVHVKGRPEWLFVKVYSHGAQSADVVLEQDMSRMLESLKEYAGRHGYRLHYMTAREAYNVAKAAEAGRDGDPESYRDYCVGPYRNTVAGSRWPEAAGAQVGPSGEANTR